MIGSRSLIVATLLGCSGDAQQHDAGLEPNPITCDRIGPGEASGQVGPCTFGPGLRDTYAVYDSHATVIVIVDRDARWLSVAANGPLPGIAGVGHYPNAPTKFVCDDVAYDPAFSADFYIDATTSNGGCFAGRFQATFAGSAGSVVGWFRDQTPSL